VKNVGGNSPYQTQLTARALASALTLTTIFAIFGILANPWLGEGYASLIFVMGISVVGALFGLVPALVGALVGALLFDYFVAEPVFEFNFERTSDLAPPLVFLACAVISGWLSGRLKDEASRANSSNQQLEHLLDVSRALQRVSSDSEIYDVLAHTAGNREASLFRFAQSQLLPLGQSPAQSQLLPLGQSPAQGQSAVLAQDLLRTQSEWLEDGPWTACALIAADQVLGVLVLKHRRDERAPLLAQARMVALALERIDLSRRLAEADAAARTEELKSALLASVSHDLRSPLTAISTSAASLLSFGAQFDSETSRELLTGIVDESSRLNHLTTNLLQMTRLQSGQEGLYWSDLPVIETLQVIIGRKLDAARTVQFCAPDQDMLVRADTSLFDLVITNVLQNAMRYSPVGTPILVACQARDGQCLITVTDEGIGIPPEEQARVFERFYRVKRAELAHSGRANSGWGAGTGLGLAIARAFVEACGGAITLASPVKHGKGTTIAIRLPLIASPYMTESSEP